jgi:arsenate reductase
MTDEVTIYHNPRCSKSRATLELLREQGIEPTIVEYLKTPPSQAELARLLDMLGMTPRELIRSKEAEYREQNLDNPDLKRKDLLKAMHDTPKLIERPIVVANGRAVLGRPPEQVLELLD